MIGRPICAGIWSTRPRRELSSDFVNENFKFFDSDPARDEANEAALETGGHLDRWRRWAKPSANFMWRIISRRKPKRACSRLVNNLKEALADRIKTLDWMDEPTKQEALKKLAAFTVKIGYPGQMARLLAAEDRSRTVRAERDARGECSKSIGS